jgi:hypothetical protein
MCFVFTSEQTAIFRYLYHKLIGFYNRDEKCLLRGTDWVFKKSGVPFVFKELVSLDKQAICLTTPQLNTV